MPTDPSVKDFDSEELGFRSLNTLLFPSSERVSQFRLETLTYQRSIEGGQVLIRLRTWPDVTTEDVEEFFKSLLEKYGNQKRLLLRAREVLVTSRPHVEPTSPFWDLLTELRMLEL
jgi:hypothetical protein